MSVNWDLLYTSQKPPVWYRVETGHAPRYLLMVDMNGVLVSLPHFSYALLCSEPEGKVSDSIFFTLRNGRLTCNDTSVKWIVRMFRPVSDHVESHKVVSWLPLEKDTDLQLASLPSNVRRKIRKAEKNGISVKLGGTELADKFYGVYAENMHRLGAPAMPAGFYAGVAQAFGTESRFVLATLQGRIIGAALWLKHGDKAEACWIATLGKYNALYTSYLLWWECVRLSCSNGCSIFSFGRSTAGSGTHTYKNQWGTRDSRLFWSYSHPAEKNRFTMGPVELPLPRREILSGIWKHMPGFAVRFLGPYLASKFY